MNAQTPYHVILFKSVSCVLKAEKILKAQKLPHKLIPVPREISPECGICLRFEAAMQDRIKAALADKVDIEEIRMIAR